MLQEDKLCLKLTESRQTGVYPLWISSVLCSQWRHCCPPPKKSWQFDRLVTVAAALAPLPSPPVAALAPAPLLSPPLPPAPAPAPAPIVPPPARSAPASRISAPAPAPTPPLLNQLNAPAVQLQSLIKLRPVKEGVVGNSLHPFPFIAGLSFCCCSVQFNPGNCTSVQLKTMKRISETMHRDSDYSCWFIWTKYSYHLSVVQLIHGILHAWSVCKLNQSVEGRFFKLLPVAAPSEIQKYRHSQKYSLIIDCWSSVACSTPSTYPSPEFSLLTVE